MNNNNNNNQLDLMFSNIDNIIDDMHEEGDLGDYSNSPLRPLINEIWDKKMQDLEKLFKIEDTQIMMETDTLEIPNETTEQVRSNYGTYMEKVESIKEVLKTIDNKIVTLEKLVEQMKEYNSVSRENLEELEKQLYKVKVGTLEGLTRGVIAKKKVEVDEDDTAVKNILEQPYDEMEKLFPDGIRGGKRRSSRKYRKNKNKKNKTKNMKGKKRY